MTVRNLLMFFISKECDPLPHYRTALISSQEYPILSVKFKILYFDKHFYLGSFILTFDLKRMTCSPNI